MQEPQDFKFLDAYREIFYSDKTYFIISGGRAGGKSTNIAAYFLLCLLGEEYFRGVISRYSQKSIKNSIYRDILDLAKSWGVDHLLNISGDEVRYRGNMIITHAMRLADGTMVSKGKGLARVSHLLIDEATECDDEQEYIKLIDSFREKGSERKIFVLFNPTSRLHWIYKRWFINDQPNPKWLHDHVFIHTTYLDNYDNLDYTKIQEWERMKSIDPEYYSHHIMGKWRDAMEGKIFEDWSFDYYPDPEAETLYGIDFGFSQDPTTCIEVKKKGKSIWIRELLYQTGLTNEDIYNVLHKIGLDERSQIFADSSEPKSVEELRRLGFNRVKGAKKGPGSILNGIKKIKEHNVYVDPTSKNLVEEYESYTWKLDKDIPNDRNNHLMDALRYALSGNGATGVYSVASGNSASLAKRHEEESDWR